MTRLDLSSNQLSDIQSLGTLSELKELNLSSNQLSDIQSLGTLSELKELNLSSNQLSDIQSLGTLSGLTKLDLSSNQLSDIQSLESLTGLTTLDLSNNQLSDIQSLGILTGLTKLDLSSNQLSDIQSLGTLTGLTELYLSDNKVFNIQSLESLTGLTTLDLSNNQLSDIQSLGILSGLTKLDLSSNQLSDIQSLETLIGLTMLYLSGNKISNIRSLGNLSGLTTLDLSNNLVQDLEVLLTIIRKNIPVSVEWTMDGIQLENCPITNPPLSIVKEGNAAILNYFDQIEKQGGTQKLYESKLIIVGEPGAGKTSLMKKLLDPNYPVPRADGKDEESTLGIDVVEGWSFVHPYEPEITFKANLWDFGGQEIQYMTHQFFLTPSALYVRVADDRKQHTNFPYWFQIINLLGREDGYYSPVLVVLNENRHRSISNFDLAFYRDRYNSSEEMEIELAEVDLSKSDERYDVLRKQIQQMLVSLKHVGAELPYAWQIIREELREEAKNQDHICGKQFSEICSNHNITAKEDQSLLGHYLHKLGSVLHFQNDSILQDFIILNPQWAVDAVYCVLKDKEIEQAGGVFTRGKLNRLWAQYDEVEQSKLFNLMKKDNFEICYEIDDCTFIAPQLLPNIQPEYEWDSQKSLKFHFQYSFMPKGIITRLVVRLNEIIAKHDESGFDLAWAKGVLLAHKDCKAQVIEDENFRSGLKIIDIEVMGMDHKRKDLLRIVRDEILSIHEKWFPNVDFQELFSCNCKECLNSPRPTFFPLQALRKHVEYNRRHISCMNVGFQDVEVIPLMERVFEREKLKKLCDLWKHKRE